MTTNATGTTSDTSSKVTSLVADLMAKRALEAGRQAVADTAATSGKEQLKQGILNWLFVIGGSLLVVGGIALAGWKTIK